MVCPLKLFNPKGIFGFAQKKLWTHALMRHQLLCLLVASVAGSGNCNHNFTASFDSSQHPLSP